VFGWKPLGPSPDGGQLYGVGNGPAPPFPAARPRAGTRPADGPQETGWLEVYEGLLSWIAELVTALWDRFGAVIVARENLEGLRHDIDFLTGLDGIATLPCHGIIRRCSALMIPMQSIAY
jgi:hypothetical protein